MVSFFWLLFLVWMGLKGPGVLESSSWTKKRPNTFCPIKCLSFKSWTLCFSLTGYLVLVGILLLN